MTRPTPAADESATRGVSPTLVRANSSQQDAYHPAGAAMGSVRE